jgi:hypothetical protein
MTVVACAGVQDSGTHSGHDRLYGFGDVAVADQPDGAAADVSHSLAEARV